MRLRQPTLASAVPPLNYDVPAPRHLLSHATLGLLYAAAAAFIMATAIAVARLGVKTDLAAADLIALRFGIGGLIFLPVLLRTWHSLPAVTKRATVPLSFAHGWGMVGCSLLGLTFAPASHAAALGPGTVPAFIALIAFMFLKRRIDARQAFGLVAICVGAAALLFGASAQTEIRGALIGDGLFMTAALLAACYLVFVEQHRVPALAGNAVVMVFSALIVIPTYLLFFESKFAAVPIAHVAWQALFQGVLMSLAYLATHQAVLKIGGARVSMIMASIPVLTLLAGHIIAGDPVGPVEVFAVIAISSESWSVHCSNCARLVSHSRHSRACSPQCCGKDGRPLA